MSTDFEQSLRTEMEQVAVRPRAGLVEEAYRSYRHKRRRMRALVTAGAAVAIAAGTAVGVTAAMTSPTAIPAQTTAYVVSHVSSALAMTNRITYTTTVMRFVQPKNGALANRVTDIWDYGTRIRQLDKSASGQPLNDSWVQTGHGRPTLIWVDYQKRSWERFAIAPDVPASRPPLCQAPESLVIALTSGLTPALSNWQSMIGAGLRCGLFHVAGHQRVEGINAIKLTGRLAGSSRTGITLWVDPHTYLPVQMAGNVQTPTGKQNGPKATIKLKQEGTIWIYFRWLPPTQANLAQLTGTIPRGFHRTKPL